MKVYFVLNFSTNEKTFITLVTSMFKCGERITFMTTKSTKIGNGDYNKKQRTKLN